MVTKKQKQILDNLTSQFEVLNTQSNSEVSLINVSEILNQHETNKRMLEEVRLNNVEFKEIQKQIVAKWLIKLNPDLNKVGLNATSNVSYIKIGVLEGHLCYTKEIVININILDVSELIGNNHISSSDRIEITLRTPKGGMHATKFTNMDELIDSARFQTGILTLFNEVNIGELIL